MPELARIVVPWDVARTADNRTRRLHWAERSRLNAAAKEAARAAWRLAGSPVSLGPVRASFVIRRARSMDHANALGGAKPAIDGLFVCAITPDDSPRWLEIGGVRQEQHRRWKGREEVEVIVEEIER